MTVNIFIHQWLPWRSAALCVALAVLGSKSKQHIQLHLLQVHGQVWNTPQTAAALFSPFRTYLLQGTQWCQRSSRNRAFLINWRKQVSGGIAPWGKMTDHSEWEKIWKYSPHLGLKCCNVLTVLLQAMEERTSNAGKGWTHTVIHSAIYFPTSQFSKSKYDLWFLCYALFWTWQRFTCHLILWILSVVFLQFLPVHMQQCD